MRRAARDSRPFDLSRVRTAPVRGRKSLVSVERFGRPGKPDARLAAFLDSMPRFLGMESLRALADAVVAAHRGGRGVAAAMGGHVVKTGCSPYVVDLMERGVVTSIALAGSTAIHDFETALLGRTSEDVAGGLSEGDYGMAEETGAAFAAAASDAAARGTGLGRALGEAVERGRFPHRRLSLLGTAARLGIPATVHVAVGTDIVHMHPKARGADLGEATFTDFRIACTVVAGLSGGVWLNVGSAVVLPEVFLKAITVARNTGHPVSDLTTGSFDMYRMYRPETNVVRRPPKRGWSVLGHHEILVPIFHALVLRGLAGRGAKGARRRARRGGGGK
jgi:GNAT superfamily N-acetyltransferase